MVGVSSLIGTEGWLERALAYFENPECAAVEGRIEARGGVTPPTPFTHILQNETGGNDLQHDFQKVRFQRGWRFRFEISILS